MILKYISPGSHHLTNISSMPLCHEMQSGGVPSFCAQVQKWSLGDNAKLYDVTHLPCRSARYTPESPGGCIPSNELEVQFPVSPGDTMPPQPGCKKVDYAVLFILGVAE